MTKKEALVKYALRLGDSGLILGQRMSEWCSKGPLMEEDLAMSNIALDLIGQSRTMLSYAGEVAGGEQTEDDLAFRRNEREYYNTLLSERPNGHFGDTVVRNFLHQSFFYHLFTALTKSSDERISAHAEKSLKEVTYHVRHSAEWVVRLGDGTEESHEKVQASVNNLWSYTGDMFAMNEVDTLLIAEGIAVNLDELKPAWVKTVHDVLERANLSKPESDYMHKGSLDCIHSEHLGHMLGDMQYLQRAYPDAKW
jgi:ring-1,2-phenylacetyl-CoA epoxidase subunit PaaC